jgi:hypothetical protein
LKQPIHFDRRYPSDFTNFGTTTPDIAFREDKSRVSKDHAAENLAVLRHMALNLLKNETSAKGGIHAKRLLAG